MRSTDDAIERAKVREVAAIFHSHEAIEAAAEALLLAGFDRADIDRLADLDEVRRRLGLIYVAHEELADVAEASREPILMREDIALTMAVVVGCWHRPRAWRLRFSSSLSTAARRRQSPRPCWRRSSPELSALW
jgi:hypothetical protein